MNRLTGRLLHSCFEQGPFDQNDLGEACNAWPQLARYCMASRTKIQGYEVGPRRTETSISCLPSISSWQWAKDCGIEWVSYVMYLGQGTHVNSVILCLKEGQDRKKAFTVAQIELHAKAREIRPHTLDLGPLMKWMYKKGTDGQIRVWYHGWPNSVKMLLFVPVKNLMDPGFCLAMDHRTARALEHVARIHRDTSKEIDPLFKVLARLAWQNQPQIKDF